LSSCFYDYNHKNITVEILHLYRKYKISQIITGKTLLLYQKHKIIMKQLVTIALIFGILGQSIVKLVLLSDYILNKESITLNFCENKSKPKLKCNGKCHLKKQLKEQEKQEAPTKNSDKGTNETQFCSQYDNTIFPRLIYVSTSHNWNYLNGETNNATPSIFHPPTV